MVATFEWTQINFEVKKIIQIIIISPETGTQIFASTEILHLFRYNKFLQELFEKFYIRVSWNKTEWNNFYIEKSKRLHFFPCVLFKSRPNERLAPLAALVNSRALDTEMQGAVTVITHCAAVSSYRTNSR